jgi:hypothetical protein
VLPFNQGSGEYPIVFDPETDTVYDLEKRASKKLVFLGRDSKPLTSPSGRPARLFQMWNAAADGFNEESMLHPQVALAEAIQLIGAYNAKNRGSPMELPTREDLNRLVVTSQFAVGMGLFLARHGITIKVDAKQLSETDLLEIRKKFFRDE